MKVLLDVSPITPSAAARTGLARVALCLARELAAEPSVELNTCAWGSLKASNDFATVARQYPEIGGLTARLSGLERWQATRDGQARRLHWALAATQHRFGQAINVCRNPLRGIDLRQFDIVHSTYARFPRSVRKTRRPTLLTLHDLTPLRLTSEPAGSEQQAITRRIVSSIRSSDWVACVSEFTRRDFLDWSGYSGDRVVVIPNGVDHTAFRPVGDDATRKRVRARFGLADAPFLLTLSSLAPHKNLALILKLWPRVRQLVPADAALVIAGGKSTDRHDLAARLGVTHDHSVKVTGFVSDEDFCTLASCCNAFLFPSLYEGFGLPVLEAMAAGAPVIASDQTSIPEVVGRAGALINPADETAWIRGMAQAIESSREAPYAPSIEQAACFSWSRAAASYRDLYRLILGIN